MAHGPDGHLGHPSEITVGVYVNDIQSIDLRTHSYVIDFYVWFRWNPKDSHLDPAKTVEFMNRYDPEGHVEETLYEEPQPQPDGSLYQIIRHQGPFSVKFPVAAYPFDRQQLLVHFEDSDDPSDKLIYSPDKIPIIINPDITLPGYALGEATLRVTQKPYHTNFGDLTENQSTPYSRVTVAIPITRPVLSGMVKTFLPILLIILCAILALLLDPTHVEARIGLSITALLTLVATQFTSASEMPEVAYLTMMDLVYIASYVLILSVIAIVVRASRLDDQGLIQGGKDARESLAVSGAKAAVLVTGLYGAVLVLIVLLHLI